MSVYIGAVTQFVGLHLEDVVHLAHEPHIAFVDVAENVSGWISAHSINTDAGVMTSYFRLTNLEAAGVHHILLVVTHLLTSGRIAIR